MHLTQSQTYSTLQKRAFQKRTHLKNQGKLTSRQVFFFFFTKHAYEMSFLISRAMNSELKCKSNKLLLEHETPPFRIIKA